MKVSNTGYVTIEIQQSILGLVRVKCVPTGQTRVNGNEIEAEGICISPGSNCEKVWFTKNMIVNEA